MPDVDPNKSVFISYRRDLSKYLARAIFMDLREHGYDTFTRRGKSIRQRRLG